MQLEEDGLDRCGDRWIGHVKLIVQLDLRDEESVILRMFCVLDKGNVVCLDVRQSLIVRGDVTSCDGYGYVKENPVRITSLEVSGATDTVPSLQALVGDGIDTAFNIAIALCEELRHKSLLISQL